MKHKSKNLISLAILTSMLSTACGVEENKKKPKDAVVQDQIDSSQEGPQESEYDNAEEDRGSVPRQVKNDPKYYEYIKCKSPGRDCDLVKNAAAPDPGFHATWTVKYTLECDTGNDTFPSTLRFETENGGLSDLLVYTREAQEIELNEFEGTGALKVVDTSRIGLSDMDFNGECTLVFTATAKRSTIQLELDRATGIAQECHIN